MAIGKALSRERSQRDSLRIIGSDLQLYLDLWAIGGRGQEAAEELRRDRLRF